MNERHASGVSDEAFAKAAAKARFEVGCDLKVLRRDGSEENHPGQEYEVLTVEEVVERFSRSPGFEDWLMSAIEDKAKREESDTDGGF